MPNGEGVNALSNRHIERLRNECANLRAEKKIWEVRVEALFNSTDTNYVFLQSVQGRLIEDNKTLMVERSHLSDLMVNVQKMHLDLERSGQNGRQRLESQMQMLENQTGVLLTYHIYSELTRFSGKILRCSWLRKETPFDTSPCKRTSTSRNFTLDLIGP
jgi:hypothetical protein